MSRDNLSVPDFDRELTLAEQLASVDLPQLAASLHALLGPFRLIDERGALIIGAEQPLAQAASAAVHSELEAVGQLQAAATPAALQAATGLIALLLTANNRYRMASELHLAVTEADYLALREKNAALQQSEDRYRTLAQSLEQQVQQQVTVIENNQRQLYQNEKLASLGQLAAGVAHEINNPIGFLRSNLITAGNYARAFQQIAGCIQQQNWAELPLLWQQLELDYLLEDLQALLGESLAGADRIAAIVAAMDAFSQIDTGQLQLLDVNEVLRTLCPVAAASIGAQARIELALTAQPRLRCVPGHFNQLLLNLLNNAAQAGSDIIRVETASEGADNVIRVIDHGCGIAPEHLSRVFDPFFTTRTVGQGTGLGLTVCRDIVTALGGQISLDSQPGHGACVTVRFPA